ncbi:hypothetical protein SAMN05880582_102220 [Rhizobium sp. RU20A]|uniref:hypothetical protein n=1 Tax=Rhizobium sp. RU20A TaxID=1907412 RepID=UPI0009561DFF|nr:hypothetical protein [Rhizobium sp. RU20A]SIQ58808.1 hypothetical protein SAMN05880582_102220 [Rhizobium sp. RU20A]
MAAKVPLSIRFRREGSAFVLRTHAVCGSPFECFFAFINWQGALWSASRYHVMFGPEDWPEDKSAYLSRIVIRRWRREDDGLVCESALDIGSGNDPRVTHVGDRAIVLFRGALNSEHPYYIYDIGRERLLPVLVRDPWFTYGKNWMPFDNNGRLGAVHGFDPNQVLDIDLETGLAELEQAKPGGFAPRAPHDNFNMMRGGANALNRNGILYGFGHATITPSHHYPFQWSLNAERESCFRLDNDVEALSRLGFSIVDPTCLFSTDDGGTFAGFCCSERDWFYDQSFAEILLPVNINDTHLSMPRIAIDTSGFQANAYSKLMLGERLRHQVESDVVPYGGRRVSHREGFVAFGQYGYLPPNRYTVAYRYQSDAPSEQPIGWADFCVCRPNECLPAHTIQLSGTGGRTVRVSFDVSVNLADDERFEARVYSHGTSVLTLHDITITSK